MSELTSVTRRKIVAIGNSYGITIPSEWFKNNELDPTDLTLWMIARKDIKILHPDSEVTLEG